MSRSRLIACTVAGEASGADAVAAAVAVAASSVEPGAESALLVDLRSSPRPWRGTLLASAGARQLEAVAVDAMGLRAVARGRICFAAPREPGADAASVVARLAEPELPAPLVACVCDPGDFRAVLAAAPTDERAALVRALPGADRSLLALLVAELHGERIPVKAWTAPVGTIPARRALAGLEPGGATGRRAARFADALGPGRRVGARRPLSRLLGAESGQALPAILGIAVLVVVLALILVAIGGAATAKGRLQRSADLAAMSAARSMRDDFSRLFVPALLPDGSPNPAHLERSEYLARAEAEARRAADRNDLDPALVEVRFPDASSMAPLQVRVAIEAEIDTAAPGGVDEGAETEVEAEAEVTPPTTSLGAGSQPTMATGGGYSGPLAYRQGKPMRPDVAAAFDRMAAAAAAVGVSLVINSAFRSDAEQQALWNANPDPRWVAPPGTSLHRCGTELDLGSPAAYGWLASNATRFGFVQRYAWECSEFVEAAASTHLSGGGSPFSGTSHGAGSRPPTFMLAIP